ncbi:MAG: FtsQ-type POTRA domain-containing protein [Clostridiales bacterium]|nr:FtsQ-type POTRA domain-containing protein [Clostridiales bacterium]
MENLKKQTNNVTPINKTADKPKLSGAVIAVLAILIAALLLLGGYFLTKVRRITVTGNENYSSDTIINLSGLYTGKNIFAYDLAAARRGINKDPYLYCEGISRKYPFTLVIRVKERKEFAAILLGGGTYCVIDETGCVLDIGRTEESVSGLLPIYGLGTMNFTVGTRIDEDGGKLRPYTVMRIIENVGDRVSSLKYIDISNSSSVKIVTANGVTVMLGDSVNIPSKIERMFKALPKVDPLKASRAIIYVNSSGSTDLSYPTPAPVITPEPTEQANEGSTDEQAEP